MIDRSKWCVCFVLISILQFILPLSAQTVAAEMQVGDAEYSPSANLDLPDSSVRDISPQVIENSQDSIPSQKVDGQVADVFEPEKRNLAGLVGKSEISVIADVYGQFSKSLTEIQTLENEFPHQLVGANLLESELIGTPATPAVVDGQSGNQETEEKFASQVDEANLLESIRAGRSFNRESLAALARTEQAKAQTGQAFALLLPSVSVRASSGYETSEPSVEIDETTGEPISSDTHLRTDVCAYRTSALV